MPFVAYLATASAHSYWLDAGELVEAAAQLDIAHPPGHPLAALLGQLATLVVPLGPIALRVALAQALCAAIAAAFAFAAIETTIRALGVRHERLSIPIALGATWLVALCPAFWFQAVRPEVYALQAMLIAIAIERVVHLEAAWPTRDVRPFYVACLALGLGLANHHFMAVLVMPAFAPTAARVYRAHGPRALAAAGGAIATGLAAYVYLPVRAHASPMVNLGDPSDFERFFWVVSARAYQHTNELSPGSGIERTLDVLVALSESLHPIVFFVALVGLYALARAPGARRLGFVWGATLVVAFAGRAWLGHNHANPDALGYLAPALLALGALTASFVGAIASQLGGSSARPPGALGTAFGAALALLGLATLVPSQRAASLAAFHATDDFDDLRLRALPPRAVVIAFMPQTVFRLWELAATEQVRPDVTIVPVPFLRYPGMAERVVDRDPTLRELVRGFLLDDALRLPDLQSLAARRSVHVEMDPVRVQPAIYETLVPGAMLYDVIEAGATQTDLGRASERRSERLATLTSAVRGTGDDVQTRAQLLWARYADAIFYARIGMRDRAAEAVAAGLELDPGARELLGLRDALAEAGTGPIDVTPFVVGGE